MVGGGGRNDEGGHRQHRRDEQRPEHTPTHHDDPLTDARDATPEGVEASCLAPMWRAAAPRLRASLERLGVHGDDADDVLQQVAVRWLSSGRTFRSVRQCARYLHVVAFNLLASRRRKAPDDELAAEGVAATRATDDFEDALVDALVVADAHAELNEAELHALGLIARGGPYTSTERVRIHRARPRLQQVFRDLLGGVAVRLSQLRGRFSNPPPAFPLVGGALMGAVLGSLGMSGATPEQPASPPTATVAATATTAEGTPTDPPQERPAGNRASATPTADREGVAPPQPPATVPVLGLPWVQRVQVGPAESGTVDKPERPLLCYGHLPVVAPERYCIPQPLRRP